MGARVVSPNRTPKPTSSNHARARGYVLSFDTHTHLHARSNEQPPRSRLRARPACPPSDKASSRRAHNQPPQNRATTRFYTAPTHHGPTTIKARHNPKEPPATRHAESALPKPTSREPRAHTHLHHIHRLFQQQHMLTIRTESGPLADCGPTNCEHPTVTE